MTRQPAVSVVMPVYNAARYLRAAIESVLRQSHADFELLIYDDASTDTSPDLLREFARLDSRIRLFRMEHRGYAHWLRLGLETASGSLIARMDADDVCLPHRFAQQVRYLREHPDVVVAGSDYEKIDEDGDLLGIARHETQHEFLLARMLAGYVGVIAHPTAMIRREPALAVGGYQPRYEPTEDLDLWLRLSEVGRLANIPEVLFQYRHHGRNVGYTRAERQRSLVAELINGARARRGMAPLAESTWSGRDLNDSERRLLWVGWALLSGNGTVARKHLSRIGEEDRRRPNAIAMRALASLPVPLIEVGAKAWRMASRASHALGTYLLSLRR